ncbi:ATP-binding protein [Pseudohalocynthiibacter aestuariivivens]|jgi:Na+/proline symporter/signal transduction histidine kinase|uniref:histidine kinase n=1 Tax=Pseudohalocynthiibacter aestuariivivens TaxID=1591409 RepID=A0ABV5JEP4_9RHOB|nr:MULTISPECIES: ATP-binding protein [Pseudohalocynthiibacter]MBS9716949.1 sodium:solute symporter [Pseudohalocynthiibacter aestuariivivens]MCK0101954.1 ATP-binding protein [Pseudohalocynthiibacter sp. F2068]
MVGFNMLIVVCLAYVVLLFVIAFFADRRAALGKLGWLQSPIVYTLSLSIYCTAWTFYGAVGNAARSGLEFVTIYLGPTLVMVGWLWIVRKLVRIGKTQRITSIADLISSRYGKSNLLGVLVTLLAVVGTTPYIALQLQSVTLSFAVFADRAPERVSSGWDLPDLNATALWVAAGLALFTVLFGTRNLDANERHHGVVTAIAFEAIVKLVALLAVGIFVVWGVASGPSDILARIDASPIANWELRPGRWAGLIFLSAAAFLCLPRMFQVMVVENTDERNVLTASWAFPLYLLLMSLFVVPIAVVGLDLMPAGSNPDLFVLTLPLSQGQDGLALLSFLGGFSSATSMVIVAAIALSTMVSNHIVMPIWLAATTTGATVSGDVRQVVLMARRISIGAVLALGYAYFRYSGGGTALAAIGLISFTGVVQVLPAMLGGIFWRRATRVGAAGGLIVGFIVWGYTLFLPSIGGANILPETVMLSGPWGLGWLRPQALFGIAGLDPVVHALIWSMVLNTLVFCLGSLLSFPTPLERLQGVQFVNIFEHSTGPRGWTKSGVESEDLLVMSQRILGPEQAQRLFQHEAQAQGKVGFLPDTSPDFLELLERELAGSVGAATAHAMIGQITGSARVSVEDLLAVADETAQILEYSSQLEAKSAELGRTARQLREANEKLTELSVQKDAFLSQISHELRTPMTSIRAFSEILRDMEGMTPVDQRRYSSIIHDETIRLTRLLDDLLDLSVLENGQVVLNEAPVRLRDVIERAVSASSQAQTTQILKVRRDTASEMVTLVTDSDRLSQVFINLIANARKYCAAPDPQLTIKVRKYESRVEVDFVDNGQGIPTKSQSLIFEKFSRLSDHAAAGGAGLGLAICREIMTNLGGTIAYLPGQGGAAFRVSLNLKQVV